MIDSIRFAYTDAVSTICYSLPSYFVQHPWITKQLGRIQSERFQWWLWNVIDCVPSPERLWHSQELGHLIALIKRNRPEDFDRIMQIYIGMDDFMSMQDYDEIYDAIGDSCHFARYYKEYC